MTAPRSAPLRAYLFASVAASALALATPVRAQTFDLNGANVTLPLAPSFPNPYLSGAVNITNSGAATILTEGGGTAATAIYSGAISDGVGAVGLTHISGVTVLSGANGYSGPTSILAGSLLAGAATGFSQASLFTVSNGASLDVNGLNSTVANLAGAGTVTNSGAQAAWLYTNFGAASTTFSGAIVDGASAVGLVSSGPGTLTLSGVNTNSLTTTISSGVISAGSITGLSPNAPVETENLGTLDLNGFNSSVNGLSGFAGTITNNGAAAATLTVDSSNNPFYYGNVQDGGSKLALTVSGAGTQTLAGLLNSSGVITINSGATLQFGDGASIPLFGANFGAGGLVDNGALILNQGQGAGGQNGPFAVNISGTGAVLQQGPGTVDLEGSNGFTGGVTVGSSSFAASTSIQYQMLFGSEALPSGASLTLLNGGVAGATYPIDQRFLDAVTTGSSGAVALAADSDVSLNFDKPSLANVSLGAASAQCDFGYYCTTFNFNGGLTAYGDGAAQGVYQFGGGNAILNVGQNLTDGSIPGGLAPRSLVQGANGIGGYTVLSARNSYSGPTTVVSGILQYGIEEALPGLGTPSVTINSYAVVAAGYALDQLTLNSITPSSQGVIALAATDTGPEAGLTVLNFNTPGLANVSLGAVGQQAYYGTIRPYVAPGGKLGTYLLGGGPVSNASFYSSLTVAGLLTDANASGPGSTNQLIVNAQAFTNPITVLLTNDETYSGDTLVQGGTLSLGDGTSNGNLLKTSSVQLQNFSTLAFQEGAGAITFDRVISGNGYVVQNGAGRVTLTQVETYGAASPTTSGFANGGGTYVFGGTLALGPIASIASSSFVELQTFSSLTPTPTLDISNGGNKTIQYLFGTTNGLVTLGANTLTLGGVTGQSWLASGQSGNTSNSHGVQPYFLGSITGTGGVVFALPQGANQTAYVFGGTNSYSGATTIASGTVQAGGVNALSPNSAVNILTGATLDLSGYSQTIASLAGAGTLTNSYAAPATLTLGGDNSSTIFSGMIGDIGATGALTLAKVGTGALTLTGANGFSGGLLLQAGAIVVGGPQALGSGTVTVSSGATLQFGAGVNLANAVVLSGVGAQNIDTAGQTAALDGPISGAGTLTKLGAGALVLPNANSYAGGTALVAGTLDVGANGALGSGALTMNAGTTLQFAAANLVLTTNVALAGPGASIIDTNGVSSTLVGAISGPGGLQKIGAGTLTLPSANSFGGGASAFAGTLAIGDPGAMGSGAVTIADGATLQAAAPNLNLANALALLAGNPNIDTLANTFTLSGVVSGAGALNKLGAGVLILSGANSSSGGVNLQTGTLALANASALGSGALALGGGTTLQSLVDGATVGNAVTLLGGGANIDTGGNALTLSGPISGPGGLAKLGSGTLVLSGANSFAGGAAVVAGTLGVLSSSALGVGALTMNPGTTLQFAGANLKLSNNVTLTAGGFVQFDTGAETAALSGVVSGAGGLQKIGSGVLALTGANSFSGGVNVVAGTLAIDSASALGTGSLNVSDGATIQSLASGVTVVNLVSVLSGQLNFDVGANQVTISGAISGPGGLTKIGQGELILTGANGFAGGVTLAQGTLGVGASGALGAGALTMNAGTTLQFTANNVRVSNPIALAGAGLDTFDTGSNASAVAGAITGGGGLQKIGAGTLLLSGANSFGGGVHVVSGTLAVGDAAALGAGALSLDNGTTLQIVADNLAIANAITLLGTDPFIDTGANTVTISSQITGDGALTKLGSGALVLTAANSYSGATSVSAGALEVDGSIASSPLTTVGAGATLLGVGQVGGVAVNAGGELAPGNAAKPFGTLTTTGAVTLAAGSTYAINLSPSAVSLLTINQTAAVAGTVAVSAQAGVYNPATKYDILTASGGVSGRFGAVTIAGLPGYSGILTYDPNNVYLQVIPGNPVGSVHDLAVSRESQMVTARILGSLLLGANEQINCTTCVSGFASVGSFALGAHGRWPLSERTTLLAGLSFDEFSAGGAQVTSAPIVAASLRYDLVDWGRSRPFFEAGAVIAPYESASYTRNYAFGSTSATGKGAAISHGLSAFARAGWVWRFTRADEFAIYGDFDRNWQKTDAYAETSGLLNPQPATYRGGVDSFDIARVGAQYTHLFGSSIELNANLALARGFGAGIGTDASVTGYGLVPNLSIAASTWVEFGARVGYRVTDRFTIDAFLLGTAGAQPAGETLHGGLGLRYSF